MPLRAETELACLSFVASSRQSLPVHRPPRPSAKSNELGSNLNEISGWRRSESCSFPLSRMPSLPLFMAMLMTDVPVTITIDVLEMMITIIIEV
jgi:hypothetical protein